MHKACVVGHLAPVLPQTHGKPPNPGMSAAAPVVASSRKRRCASVEPFPIPELPVDVWWCIVPFLTVIEARDFMTVSKRFLALLRRRASRTLIQHIHRLLGDLRIPNARLPVPPWPREGGAAPAPAPVHADSGIPLGPDALLSGSFMWFALREGRRIRRDPGMTALQWARAVGFRPKTGVPDVDDRAPTEDIDAAIYAVIRDHQAALSEAGVDDDIMRGLHWCDVGVYGSWIPCDIDIFCSTNGYLRMGAWLRAHGYVATKDEEYNFDGKMLRVIRWALLPGSLSTIEVSTIVSGEDDAASTHARPRFDIDSLEIFYDGRSVHVNQPVQVMRGTGHVCAGARASDSRVDRYRARGMVLYDDSTNPPTLITKRWGRW